MQASNNLVKYQTKNPIKKILIKMFSNKIISILKNINDVNNIIDAGCGEGFMTYKISKEIPNVKIDGMDISETSIKIAKKTLPNKTFYIDDITNTSISSRSYNMVLALEILEHLTSPEIALKEISRITNNYCLISVPWEPFFSIGNVLSGKNISRLGNDEEHLQKWSKNDIIKLISKHFNVMDVHISFPWIIILAKKQNKQ